MQLVAPLVGAWIEITVTLYQQHGNPSLPSWERGLKYSLGIKTIIRKVVAPLVGAWIEITSDMIPSPANIVAPLVGAWIEILCPLTV